MECRLFISHTRLQPPLRMKSRRLPRLPNLWLLMSLRLELVRLILMLLARKVCVVASPLRTHRRRPQA